MKHIMNRKKLEKHIKLCRRNLKNVKVKCCLDCPFKEIIVQYHPEMNILFNNAKRRK